MSVSSRFPPESWSTHQTDAMALPNHTACLRPLSGLLRPPRSPKEDTSRATGSLLPTCAPQYPRRLLDVARRDPAETAVATRGANGIAARLPRHVYPFKSLWCSEPIPTDRERRMASARWRDVRRPREEQESLARGQRGRRRTGRARECRFRFWTFELESSRRPTFSRDAAPSGASKTTTRANAPVPHAVRPANRFDGASPITLRSAHAQAE